jgi:NTP pyrophosphatase (non-canonical NTP hydrolase)
MDLENYKKIIQKFADERNWEKYHTPKNLAMALSGEVGELVEVFQWLSEDESKTLSDKDLQSAKEEIADVFIYLLRLCDKLGVDLQEAVNEKINLNAEKYPINLARDNAIKYNKR